MKRQVERLQQAMSEKASYEDLQFIISTMAIAPQNPPKATSRAEAADVASIDSIAATVLEVCSPCQRIWKAGISNVYLRICNVYLLLHSYLIGFKCWREC